MISCVSQLAGEEAGERGLLTYSYRYIWYSGFYTTPPIAFGKDGTPVDFCSEGQLPYQDAQPPVLCHDNLFAEMLNSTQGMTYHTVGTQYSARV